MINDYWWHALIIREPDNTLHYHAYADWLEEQGNTLTPRAFRWMAVTHKRPGKRCYYKPSNQVQTRTRSVPRAVEWGWFLVNCAPCDSAHIAPCDCELPGPLFVAIGGVISWGHVYYPCWLEAVDALVHGLERMRQIQEGCC